MTDEGVRDYARVEMSKTYVGSRKDGDQDPVVEKLVAIFNHHVRSADQIKVMPLQELHDDLLPKAVTDPPFVRLPIRIHLGRVTPQQVIQQTVVGHIGRTSNLSDVVHVRQRWR